MLNAFLDFIYPANCIHCSKRMAHGEGGFCIPCGKLLELIDLETSCPYCFSHDYDPKQRVCYPCYMQKPIFKRSAAAFDYLGPAASLFQKMKDGNQPYLARGAGAFMTIQLLRLNWPTPDLIVPVPLPIIHHISRGYNQNLLLAEAIGKLLNCPVEHILKRELLHPSQTEKKIDLEAEAFKFNNKSNIQDQVILLVDDLLNTGHTLNCCAEVLYQGFPRAVYGLTLCRSMYTPRV